MPADLFHLSARELASLVASRQVSSRELLDVFAARIDRHNPAVNAVVTLDLERASAAARAADDLTASGAALPPLHGLPITVKDALAVNGIRSTGGATELTDHVPSADADVVARVRADGAIPFAKTNVPRWSGDLQTYNDIFGTTNNPWDASRVPGGSSGGAATSVALGFTAFELGTDIGGSIRIPAAYCGIVGHKPSYGLVPCGGYLDRVGGGLTEPDINVHGPLARSVDDLELLLDLLAGPRPDRAIAWSARVPVARHERIDGYRVAVWADSDSCPASTETVAAVHRVGEVLSGLGARVAPDARPGIDADAAFQLGLWLIVAAVTPSLSDAEFEGMAQMAAAGGLPDSIAAVLGAYTADHRRWQAADVARTHVRAAWAEFSRHHDALVCPVIVTPPFPHNQQGTPTDRTVAVDGAIRPYSDLFWWTMLIGMAYLPATVIPVGTTSDGLPIAVQIVAPYLEDRTALAIARAVRDALGPMTFPSEPRPRDIAPR